MSSKEIIKRSILAGVLIAIGALFSIAAKPYGNVVQGICFSVGLFGVLCCGAILFTGQALAVQAVWRKETAISDVFSLWLISWALNLFGAVCVALMASKMGFDVTSIVQAKAAMSWHELLIRSVLCNVMVCMAVWTYRETQRSGWERNRGASLVLDALASCVLPVSCFVTCGFEHSVADMFYMSIGCFTGVSTFSECIYVIGIATVGNIIGGTAFAWLVWEKS